MKQKNMLLMVVAVGCGLVAAFLTSTMSGKTAAVETQSVVVASKDIPVGTTLTKEELKNWVKLKKLPKDGLPVGVVEVEDELVGQRLTRAVRTDEPVNKKDLTSGGVITIPKGMSLVTLQLDLARASAGFAGPGSRVDILASIRLENRLSAMPVLVNMLVLAVDGQTTYSDKGVFQSVSTVSFAATRQQALVLELAKARGCPMSLLLRHPDEIESEYEKGYDIEKIVRLLQDERNPITPLDQGGDIQQRKAEPKAGEPVKPAEPTAPAPAPVAKETVKVPYALAEIKAGTAITKDLIADPAAFGVRELPKDVAQDALTDLDGVVGQVFTHGLGKGQWVTRSLVGEPVAKLPPPPDVAATPSKDDLTPPPAGPKATPGRAIHDVTIHTASESRTYRYEEVEAGRWRMLYEVPPQGRRFTPAAEPAAKPAPAAAVPERKVD